jgi:hypothetical protein
MAHLAAVSELDAARAKVLPGCSLGARMLWEPAGLTLMRADAEGEGAGTKEDRQALAGGEGRGRGDGGGARAAHAGVVRACGDTRVLGGAPCAACAALGIPVVHELEK